MEEEGQVSVEETQEGLAEPTNSTEHNDVSTEAQRAEQQKRTDAEHNWAEMRRKMREKDQQIEELRNQFTQVTATNSSEEDELSRLSEDDILTVAQAKKLAQQMAKNVAENVIKEREAKTVNERIELKYPDYGEIVTQENIKLAETLEPELAEVISKMDDPYTQRVSAYKLLKRITEKKDSSSLEKKKAQENAQKPLSVNAVTKNSAIGNAHLFENGLTPELKSQLWKEMKDAMKAS